MQGEDVYLIHTELKRLRYELPPEETERSFFDEGTLQTVLDFQRKHSLEPTGVVDQRTAHAINMVVEASRPIPFRFKAISILFFLLILDYLAAT